MTKLFVLLGLLALFALAESQVNAGKKSGDDNYCVPGSRFKDEEDCNWCSCADNGKIAACTLKLCPKHKRDTRNLNVPLGQKGYCTPHGQYYEDCNTCTCNGEGTFGRCTRLRCPSKASTPKE